MEDPSRTHPEDHDPPKVQIDFRVLGPVELRVAGARKALGPIKQCSVLAILLLSQGRAVPSDALLSRIWDGRPPRQAHATLRSYVSRLRRRLRDTVGDSALITHVSDGYTLKSSHDALDLNRFRALHRQARAIAGSGAGDYAVSLLRKADDLWQGEALAGLPGIWLQGHRHRINEERRIARIERIRIEMELGYHHDLIGELYELVARHPLDEGLVEALMTALFRSDRKADALMVFHRTRCALSDSQGIGPGSRLREIYHRILNNDIELAVTPRYRHRGHGVPPNTIPSDIDSFIGRPVELAKLTGDQPSGCTTTTVITGMPGAGKTALAVRAAHQLASRRPDARLYLDLAAFSPTQSRLDPASALAQLLQMLGITADQIPRSLSERAKMWQAEMSIRRSVLLLDDAADADQVRHLLPHSPTCTVLVTSRNTLQGLESCRTLSLDVMKNDEAVQLFALLSGLDTEKDRRTVRAMVRRCGYLPLEIRITAGQVRESCKQGLTEMLENLCDSVPQTRNNVSDRPQASAAFERSYRHLSATQQRVFRHLGIHPCRGITPYSAAALTATPISELRPVLDTLVDQHLLEPANNGSLRFHDLVKNFAKECIQQEEGTLLMRAALSRLLRYYLKTSDLADRILFPHRSRLDISENNDFVEGPHLKAFDEAKAWMEAEWRSALEVAHYAITREWKMDGALLVHVMAEYLDTEGQWEEAAKSHELALNACRDLCDTRGMAQALAELGYARYRTAHYDSALSCAFTALSIHRRCGNKQHEARTLDHIGVIQWSSGRSQEALAYYQEALQLSQSAGDRRGEADALGHSGVAYLYLGRCDEAMENLGQAISLYRRIGDKQGEAKALNNLGDVQQHRGYHHHAVELYQASKEILDQIPGRPNQAILINNTGTVRRHKGDYPEALTLHRKALQEFRATGHRKNVADALNCIGMTYWLMGEYDESLIHYDRAKKIAVEISDSYDEARARQGIADALSGMGRHREALRQYNKALTVARDTGDILQEAKVHDAIAYVISRLEGDKAARIHWRQALDLYARIGVPESQQVRRRLETGKSDRASDHE